VVAAAAAAAGLGRRPAGGGRGRALSTGAFQAGTLSASLPIIDTVEPVAGVVIGAVLFDEQLAASPAALLVRLAAGAVAVAGIVMLGPALAAAQSRPDRPDRPGPGRPDTDRPYAGRPDPAARTKPAPAKTARTGCGPRRASVVCWKPDARRRHRRPVLTQTVRGSCDPRRAPSRRARRLGRLA
jgi:hypothetical protein